MYVKQMAHSLLPPRRIAAAVALALSGAALLDINAVQAEQTKAAVIHVAQADEDSNKLLAEYRQVVAETQSLKVYNGQLTAQVKSQQGEIDTMTQQLSEIDTTSREVLPMMEKMVTTLEQFVTLDIPFLPEERAGRIATLKDMMSKSDVSVSEKYRRIVEAYQVETEYGRTVEAYQGKVGDKTVDFLRAGRVSLLYQSLDGKETGYWDATAKKFKVDDRYEDAIKSGLKVAKKQSAPDFITVAVRAPKNL
jgi:hypothetical protein